MPLQSISVICDRHGKQSSSAPQTSPACHIRLPFDWPIQKSTAATTDAKPQSTVTLAPGIPDAITVEPLVIERLGIKIARATEATLPIDIKLLGTLSLDPTQLEQDRCRFDGEVVEIGKVADGSRQIQFGDSVKLG